MIKTKSNLNAKRAFCVDCAYHKKKVNMWEVKLKSRQRTTLFRKTLLILLEAKSKFLQIIGKSNLSLLFSLVHVLIFFCRREKC